MKTIIITFCVLLCTTFAFGQNNSQSWHANNNETTSPVFTGIKNYQVNAGLSNELLNNYLNKHIVYPATAIHCRTQGTEIVEFEVLTDGSIDNFKIINGVCPAINDEMVRVLKTTNGMWTPALENGQPVAMKKQVTVVFGLANSPTECIKDFNKCATCYFKRANTQMLKKGNYKKAERLYSQGIVYLPNDQSLLLMRGLCRYELGNTNGAMEDWARFKQQGGYSIETAYLPDATKQLKGYNELLSLLKTKDK